MTSRQDRHEPALSHTTGDRPTPVVERQPRHGIPLSVILLLVGTPVLLSWGSRGAEEACLAPLGMASTRTPGLEADVIGRIGRE